MTFSPMQSRLEDFLPFFFFFVFTVLIGKLGCLLHVGKVCNMAGVQGSNSSRNTPTEPSKGIYSRLGGFMS